MLRPVSYVLLLLLSFATAAEAAEKPVISFAMRYADARARMLLTGFHPYRTIAPDSDLFRRSFASREDIGHQFPEAAKCEPKSGAPCYFLFARGPNEIVAIATVGAHAQSLIVRKVHVATVAEAQGLYEK